MLCLNGELCSHNLLADVESVCDVVCVTRDCVATHQCSRRQAVNTPHGAVLCSRGGGRGFIPEGALW